MTTCVYTKLEGCSHCKDGAPPRPSRDEVNEIRRSGLLSWIEDVVGQLVCNSMIYGEPLILPIPEHCWKHTVYDERLKLRPRRQGLSVDQVAFGLDECSEERFVTIIHLLYRVYVFVTKRETSTIRALYYHDKAQFQFDQTNVDHGVNDVCRLLGVSPWDLGIMPLSKGLVAGPLMFLTANDEDVDCRKLGGVLIPQNVEGMKSIVSTAEVIIIIEKDSAFQKCINEGSLNKPWLIITGKGVPDRNSRLFVNKLWKTLKIPVYAMVDADPYGIEIMCTYRFGSCELSHLADKLATPAIKWLGIYPTELTTYIIPSAQLSPRDTSKLKSLQAMSDTQALPRFQAELQYMLDANKKTNAKGFRILATRYNIVRYISHKLRGANVI